jgi:hypothetical protein
MKVRLVREAALDAAVALSESVIVDDTGLDARERQSPTRTLSKTPERRHVPLTVPQPPQTALHSEGAPES